MKAASLRNLPPDIVRRFWEIKNALDRMEKSITTFQAMKVEVERSWKKERRNAPISSPRSNKGTWRLG